MELSVVVPTLNGRDRLAGTLDALASSVPAAEVVVVNGPSADGTTGMVRERDDVDVLVEIPDRSVATARNAGIGHASGSVVALVDHGLAVDEAWAEAVRTGLADADVVTGPTRRPRRAGAATETVEIRTVAGREVTYFNSGNVAFDRAVLDAFDGYDEYLEVGGSRDLAHRLADSEFSVEWAQSMAVERTYGADGGEPQRDWGWKYRSLAYRLTKNYGTHPTVFRRLFGHAGKDAVDALGDVVRRKSGPSKWLATGRDVLSGAAVGLKDGLSARARDRSIARNPHGASKQAERAVSVYDWR
ncbi:glycosyltransferase family 2 protein [Halapricum hydrolyticum]|uniref:Glycosyltransferase n=1 Tax=Halapricum hydrolyticum TaxID=2979991 RepID=A0AAE3IE23_9EURY|nr:glycosyltransferase [Halapricum hydrolyticum]MCU4717627.1 glycosyltransferase [Halapricum hydrolyticum]MCU4726844.1 glycosyltransferase [Halapricum hydrolyticum]